MDTSLSDPDLARAHTPARAAFFRPGRRGFGPSHFCATSRRTNAEWYGRLQAGDGREATPAQRLASAARSWGVS
jgi:hypothetical protein